MRRRDALRLGGSALLARLAAGCDRLVVLGPLAPELLPITPNDEFYVYSYASTPSFEGATHQMLVLHEETELARFDLAFLSTLDAREREHTLECIGARPRNQDIGNAVWGGVPLTEVLDALGVSVPASAVGLRLVGMDDYHAGVPIEDLESPIWIVWLMNGVPLPMDHGFPARLLVPGRYGVKNLKWIREIAFVDEPHVSYWTATGWSEEAVYRPNTFVVSPIDGMEVRSGELVRFVGTAFAGLDEIASVEVRVDGGGWEPVALDYQNGPQVWTLWSWEWMASGEGDHTVQMRCTTVGGEQSVEVTEGTSTLAGYNGSMTIGVRVTG